MHKVLEHVSYAALVALAAMYMYIAAILSW